MTTPYDPSTDRDYLWDPTAAPDAAVVAIERHVSPVGFDPASRPLPLGIRPRRASIPTFVWRVGLAAAALVLVATSVVAWRWTWPEGRSWPMRVNAAGVAGPRVGRLVVGQPLTVGAADTARVDVARIGSMDVRGGSDVTLRSTASNRHRLVLMRGAVDVRVWAPPGAVTVQTPAGDVIDLGCIFRLEVDATDLARVSVETGWVQLNNLFGELLVPAGASSEMRASAAPLVAVYDDAAARFRDGVRAFERSVAGGTAGTADLTFVTLARRRDVYTLLLLSRTAPAPAMRVILDRASELVPPPQDVSLDRIAAGDRAALWRWLDALDLPPPKNWWRNWRDAFVWFR